jgi:two-component system, sensor histidine kinase
MKHDRPDDEHRLLVLAPTAKDASVADIVFERAGVLCVCCKDLDSLCDELAAGAAAIVLPEESVSVGAHDRLANWISSQEPWSDLPVLLLARHGADSPAVRCAMDVLGNVTVLERPTRISALVSAARSALRARQRQYQLREHVVERDRIAEQLLANDRRKDEFLAILAHELRNPLAPIVNSIRLLGVSRGNEAQLERIREIMDRQVHHMVRLVDDLLEVSRITRGKIELRKETVDLLEVVRTVVDSVRGAIEAAHHTFTVELPPGEVILDADPVRLAQVLTNVITNAIKYTDPGGQIRLIVALEDDRVAIYVSDTGRGIPGDKLPRVFDLFMQVEHDASRTQGGLGIGLTLVHRLVQMHGGSVSAFSEGPGRGSEFTIRLPFSTAASAAKVRSTHVRVPANFARRRVLIVDDNHDAADSLGSLLELLGAEPVVVYSGQEALQKLATFRPSAILLDIGMPGMDGHEAARRIRRMPELGDVTLIAMTGWGQEEDRHRTQAAGFDHHLTKPADVDVLASLLFHEPPENPDPAAPGMPNEPAGGRSVSPPDEDLEGNIASPDTQDRASLPAIPSAGRPPVADRLNFRPFRSNSAHGLEPVRARRQRPRSLSSERAHARTLDSRGPARRPAVRAPRDGPRGTRRRPGAAPPRWRRGRDVRRETQRRAPEACSTDSALGERPGGEARPQGAAPRGHARR